MIIQILQIIAIIGTILVGLFSLFNPKKIEGFTGIKPMGARGVVEVRSIFGAVFIGLGVSALLLDPAVSYPFLGIVYLSIAAVRLISTILDRSFESSNLISLGSEIVFGIIMVF